MKNLFRVALKNAMLDRARLARLEGTTAMSVDCLMQCVRPPSSGLDGAPRGTNARYYYAQMFREIVATSAQLSRFTRI